MNKLTNILAGLALCALSSIASATTISGGIGFNGNLTTDTDDVTTASVFTFMNPVSHVGFDSFLPLAAVNISYSVVDLGALPIAPLWTAIGSDLLTYTFVLESVNSSVDGVSRALEGIGTMTIGTDSAIYSWNLTTQNPAAGGSPAVFSFSASQVNVPEPAIALLLATGLIGFGFTRRARKSA